MTPRLTVKPRCATLKQFPTNMAASQGDRKLRRPTAAIGMVATASVSLSRLTVVRSTTFRMLRSDRNHRLNVSSDGPARSLACLRVSKPAAWSTSAVAASVNAYVTSCLPTLKPTTSFAARSRLYDLSLYSSSPMCRPCWTSAAWLAVIVAIAAMITVKNNIGNFALNCLFVNPPP